MKKYKWMKVVSIIGVVFLIVGAGILGAGIASGGSLRYLSVNKETAEWWPFSNGSIGFGLELGDIDIDGAVNTYQEDLSEVKSVQIDADAGDIEIRRGDKNMIEYQTRKKEYVNFENKNGHLRIVIDHDSVLHNIEEKIVLQLTDALYDEIKVHNNLGDIDIQGIRAKSFDLNLNLGDIDVANIYSDAFQLDQKCGDIDISGILLGNSSINNKLGETDIILRGNVNEYRYKVSNSLGDTSVLGNEKEFNANIEGGSSSAKNSVIVDNKLGDIEFDIR